MQRLMTAQNDNQSAGDIIRIWRQSRKISQMDLALDVDVSSKHLSFVETGRAKPSRSLVLKLAHSLKLPLRHRNALLKAAGYAPEYGEEPLNGQKMLIIRQALRRILDQHEPYPALVINAGYKILMSNKGFKRIIRLFDGEAALEKHGDAIRLLFAENGLKRYIKNWLFVERFLMTRLWEEAVSTQNSDLTALYNDISKPGSDENFDRFPTEPSLPVLTLDLEKESIRASFFTTVSTFGTPIDLTAQELRIESLFPADERTKALFSPHVMNN